MNALRERYLNKVWVLSVTLKFTLSLQIPCHRNSATITYSLWPSAT